MDHRTMTLPLLGLLLLVLMALLYYSLRLQKKAVGTQDGAMSKVDESLALGRESFQRQKDNLALVQELVLLQRETNRLLAIIADASVQRQSHADKEPAEQGIGADERRHG